ncbi:MAG: TonB-dependent receptor domain-containing protein [Asticcacaulis sp.]
MLVSLVSARPFTGLRFGALVLSLGFGIALYAAPSQAADTEPQDQTGEPPMKTVVVRALHAPTKSARIDDTHIALTQPETLNDLLAPLVEVDVSGANRSAAQKVYVRGIEETYLNVTVDGARQSGNLYAHNGNMGIDPDLLKRVSVAAGTGSALDGPGALGGAVRYETRDAEDLLIPGHAWGGRLALSGHSNGQRTTQSVFLYGKPDTRLSVLVYGNQSQADSYKDGAVNRVSDTDNEPKTGLVKIRLSPDDHQSLRLSYEERQDNGFRAYKANFGIPAGHPEGLAEDQKFVRKTTTLRYGLKDAQGSGLNLSVSLYENKSSLSRMIAASRGADWWTRGLDLRNESRTGRLQLIYGYDATWERSRGRSGSGQTASETVFTQGLYLQGDLDLTPTLTVSAGARHDRARMTDLSGYRYTGQRTSPNAHVRYSPTPAWAVHLSWAQAYRGVRPIEGLTLILPEGLSDKTDRSLKGERAETFEAGLSFSHADWGIDVVAFDTTIRDTVLYWAGRGRPFSRRNGGDLETRGVTASFRRAGPRSSLSLSYTHSDQTLNGLAVGPGDWLKGASPQGDKLLTDFIYRFPNQNLTLNWRGQWVFKETRLPKGVVKDDFLKGYATQDIGLEWKPTPHQHYSASITNLLDENYIDHTTPLYVPGGDSTLYEPGRNIRLSARWVW